MDIRQADTRLGTGADVAMNGTGKLSDKVALITGGTTGIGAATATCFQAAGVTVSSLAQIPQRLKLCESRCPDRSDRVRCGRRRRHKEAYRERESHLRRHRRAVGEQLASPGLTRF